MEPSRQSPNVSVTFELPRVFLHEYPDVATLKYNQTRQSALAIYYYNRTIQTLLDSLSHGHHIRGLTSAFVISVLEMIATNLDRLRTSYAAPQLTHFLTHETSLLDDCRSRWSDLGYG